MLYNFLLPSDFTYTVAYKPSIYIYMETHILEEILIKAKDLQANGRQLTVVFDLDSTIFDLSQRQIKIFHEFAERFKQKYPIECDGFYRVTKDSMTYYPEDCLKNVGVVGLSEDFIDDFYSFWEDRFFSNEYTKYDIPEPGAKEYIDKLKSYACNIVYLTGRDIERMGIGTHAQLSHHEFMGSDQQEHQVTLKLKPEASMIDDIFKSEYLLELCPNENDIVFIDNEPQNLVKIAEDHPDILLIYFDSYHSGKAEIPETAITINSFLF